MFSQNFSPLHPPGVNKSDSWFSLFNLIHCDGNPVMKVDNAFSCELMVNSYPQSHLWRCYTHIKLGLGVCLLNGLLRTDNLYTNTKVKMRHQQNISNWQFNLSTSWA
jgi:hypothetical protein